MREIDEGFYEWVRTQPEWRCIITDRPDAERCHIKSRGAGGSDRYIMPLVREHHAESHSKPAWWYRNKSQIAQWCAEALPVLWARYDEENQEPPEGAVHEINDEGDDYGERLMRS